MERVPSRYLASDFEFEFPHEAVAQQPLPNRDDSRLLVLRRDSGAVEHRTFHEVADLLEPGDVLVINVSRVMAARLKGVRSNGREAEILLVHEDADGTWLAMVHPGGKLKAGRTVHFGDDLVAEILEVVGGGLRKIRLTGRLLPHELMERYGNVPLPPYIRREPDSADRERYQTVFARANGSVAAPTAGLHFTEQTLSDLRAKGVEISEIVLHVGPGTFKPVAVDDPADHIMHAEWYSVSPETAASVTRARECGGRVWAVGSTSTRVLETAWDGEKLCEGSGWTDLFIYPPYSFKAVDAILTNFHLPRSTLLMLVAAFAGYDHTMRAYKEAVASSYRLYSYGDAMAIV